MTVWRVEHVCLIAGRLPFMRAHRQMDGEEDEERKNNREKKKRSARCLVESYCHLLAQRRIYEEAEV